MEGRSMTAMIIEGLEKEGFQCTARDKQVYQQILDSSENWLVPTNRSESEIWTSLEETLAKPKARTIILKPWLKWAASVAIIAAIAASLILIMPDTQSFKAYEIQEISLPDGSIVSLNAGSSLAYSENFFGARILTLDGKAFFDVVKGDEFLINTANGTIAVLGTSFNVNTFNNELIVECFTGKVKVDVPDKSLFLTPGLSVKASNGHLGEVSEFDVTKSKSWIDGEFYFQNTSLAEVFVEVERQFGVEIKLEIDIKNRTYTGLFNNTDNVVEVLKTICLPMSLVFDKAQNNTYVVTD